MKSSTNQASISNIENKRKLSQKKDVICSRGAASTEVFVAEHAQSIAYCIFGAAFPGISVICNSKILSNKMCFFVLFQLLEICIVDVAHSGKKIAHCEKPEKNEH